MRQETHGTATSVSCPERGHKREKRRKLCQGAGRRVTMRKITPTSMQLFLMQTAAGPEGVCGHVRLEKMFVFF